MCVQITYILGAAHGHSFVIGYGCRPPRSPHHRDSALTLQESGNWHLFNTREENANQLVGGMVGGPDAGDLWEDDRGDYRRNEVALDYNAALLVGVTQVCACFTVPVCCWGCREAQPVAR